MSTNTKATENVKTAKKAVATKPVAEKKQVEKKPVAEKAPKFDVKAYGQNFIKEFKSDVVDLVFDTELKDGPRAVASTSDYQYIHIFRKGTQKNCFQMYLNGAGVRLVDGKNIDALIPESKAFTKRPKIKNNQVAYIDYLVSHDKAMAVLTTVVEAYKKNLAKVEAEKAKAEKEKAEAKAKKEAKKEVKAEVKKEAKPKKDKKVI